MLWYLTVGSVRGFAFFLGLSTVIDLVVAYFFTRPAVILLSRSPSASPVARCSACAVGERGRSHAEPDRRAGPHRERRRMTTTDDRTDADPGPPPDQRAGRLVPHRLYHGETNFDFVGRRRIGFGISGRR